MEKILKASFVLVLMVLNLMTGISQKPNSTVRNTKEFKADVFDKYIANWVEMLTCNSDINMSDSNIALKVNSIANQAQSDWNNLNTAANRTYTWNDIQANSKPGDENNITTAYRRLANMALAYRSNGSFLKGNTKLKTDIVNALKWQYVNRYNSNTATQQYGNWYIWEIGAPEQLNNAIMLMYKDIPSSDRANYVAAENAHARSYTGIHYLKYNYTKGDPSTGGNLSHKASQFMNQAVIIKDLDKYNSAKSSYSTVYDMWQPGQSYKGDGFHEDGSFIQHYTTLYNGSGYFKAVFDITCQLMPVVSGTILDFDSEFKMKVYNRLERYAIPVIYKGLVMDLARGRMLISNTDHSDGKEMTQCFLKLSQTAPAATALKFKRLSKYWIQSDTYYSFKANCDLKSYILEQEVINNRGVTPLNDTRDLTIFSFGAKATLIRPDLGFGISMTSKYASPYESINGENIRGYNSGFGMIYNYGSDLGYYTDQFWQTVDPYRLAGTTVTTETRSNAFNGWRYNNSQSWVGGTILKKQYGSIGMDLEGYANSSNTPLKAKKSWFVFDNEIVALGTGISVGYNTGVESILENRKLKNDNTNVITINGTAKLASLSNTETTLNNVNTIHITGNTLGTDIGYYLPEPVDLKYLRQARTGSNSLVNLKSSTTPFTKNYTTFWFNHGASPKNGSYQYVILPNMTSYQTTSYSKSPHIKILENSTDAQGVYETTMRMTAVNFWNDITKTVGGITSNKKASVVMQLNPTNSDTLSIAISDPTLENTGTITIEINKPVSNIISKDNRITITQLTPTINFTVDVNNALGASIHAVFGVDKN